MAPPPPPSPFTDHRGSLEGEPKTAYDEPQWPDGKPETPETLGERTEAGRMEVKGKSARGRADVSLDSLRERTKTRSYDKETPDLINRVTLFETPEKQQDRLDALSDVSVVMLATLLYHHPDLEKKFDLGDFANIPLLGEMVAASNPRPAENAAFHKLRELRDNPKSQVAQHISRKWPQMVEMARELSRNISIAADTNLNGALKGPEEWTVRGAIQRMPKSVRYGLALAGAVAGFFVIRGIFRALTKSNEETEKSGEKTGEKPKSAWGWVKWALAGALAVFGLGSIFGWKGTLDWIKKQGGKAKEAWDTFFGDDPEFAKNKEMYTRMAGRIEKEMSGEETKVAIDPKFLASLHDKKYQDIVDDDSWVNKSAEWLTDAVLDNDAVNAVAKRLPGNFIYTKAQRNQYRAIRSYLKGSERQRRIAEIGIGADATLGQVLAKLDQKLNQNDGLPGGAPGETPQWNLVQVENRMLPYFKENYGTDIDAEDFRKVAKVPYRDLMAGKGARAYFEALRTRARTAGAEMGVSTVTTAAEQRVIDAENTARKFFIDNEALLKSLNLPDSLPAGATVGDMFLAIAKSGKFDDLKGKEILGAVAGVTISNEEIEGTSERDEIAKRLSGEQFNIYITHKRMLREMVDDHVWVSHEDGERMMAASLALAEKLEKEAHDSPDKSVRDKKWKLASQLRTKAEDIRLALLERSEHLKAYKAVLGHNGGNDDLHAAFLKIGQSNEKLGKAYALQERTITKERLWQSVGTLAALQLPRAAYVYFSAPAKYRSFVRHYYGVLGLPTAAMARMIERIRRPTGGLALAELRVEEGQRRLRGDLGGADASGAGSLEERANLGTDTSNIKEIERAKHRYAAEKNLYDHDIKIRDAQRELFDLQAQAEALRKANLAPDAPDLARLETSISEKVAELKGLKRVRIPIEQKALGEAADELYSRLTEIGDEALSPEQWRELDDLARRGAENHKSVMHAGEEILEDISRAAARGAPKDEIEALQKSFNELVGTISSTQKSLLQRFAGFLDARMGRVGKYAAKAVRAPGQAWEVLKGTRSILTPALRKKGLAPEERRHFRKVLAKILHWQRHGEASKAASESTPLLRVVKGKLLFFGLKLGAFGAVAGGLGLATMDKKTGFARTAGQVAFDMAPVTGTISDILAAVQGREVISGRKVTGFERFALRPAFALVGAASDILLIAGVGVGVRAGLGALRGGLEAARLVRLRTAIKVAGDAAAQYAGKAAAKEGAAMAAERSAKAVAKETAEGANRMLDFLRRVDKRRTVATVSLMALGIGVPLAMSFVKQDEMEVSPGLEAVAGGEDGKIDDIDIEKMAEESGNAEE